MKKTIAWALVHKEEKRMVKLVYNLFPTRKYAREWKKSWNEDDRTVVKKVEVKIIK